MNITPIQADFSVCPQILVADLQKIKDLGFRSIICNRPDDEAPDQPRFATIADAAKEAGLAAVQIPVSPGQMSRQHIAAFDQAMMELPRPVLAYCRSGARSAALANASHAAAKTIRPSRS